MTKKIRRIYVDADSCPVKEEVTSISTAFRVEVIFVSSYAHYISAGEDVRTVQVDSEKEAVDFYIINRASRDDVVVTQDHALASILVGSHVRVISPRGMIYDAEEIPLMLEQRHIARKERRAGNKTKGPRKFTNVDRQRFCENFKKILLEKKEYDE